MAYRIFLRPAAVRDLDSLPGDVGKRLGQAIDRLSENPRPPGSKKLVGFENEWRLRVGNYRVLYVVDDSTKRVTIARVAHRREAYR
jgi:mRNA interferase RelE/StbE